ncbi:hypothetical protein [Nitrospira sp. Nam74]
MPIQFTDLDFVVVRDRLFLIGEVKSDPKAFREKYFEKMRVVAEDLQPDEVILAAPDIGGGWPPEVNRQSQQLATALSPLDIKVSPLLLRWQI